MFVIYIVGLANGELCKCAGAFVKTYDPDAHGGIGEMHATFNRNEAKKFETLQEAVEFWRQQSTVRPLRWDDKPNRPLTAFTVEYVPDGFEPAFFVSVSHLSPEDDE